MKTTLIGNEAEEQVAETLSSDGYKILAQNWRTRVCEIDIVASKDKIVYFVEVKYRSSNLQGSGIEYITPKKLNQIKFAAQIWAQENNWDGDYRILGAEVSDRDIKIIEID
jgi:uncharacterized protein (TIGR00252 family)